jgi:DNA modification methylase
MPTILRGDARHLPLADNTVDCVVTSPPYFGLRSYQDGGKHYDGQIGSEATPAAFVDALIDVTRECLRVLKPSGSLFVNLGDKYGGTDGTTGGTSRSTLAGSAANGRPRAMREGTFNGGGRRVPGRPKSLLGIPWRYALRCIDDLGLILRAEIIWRKPNGLPESVTDRVRRSHEQWFHFVQQPRYYSAVDEIRESHNERSLDRYRYSDSAFTGSLVNHADDQQLGKHRKTNPLGNPLGKLPGSVWEIPAQPLKVPAELGVDHFAAFPMEFPRRLILGWSPREVCTVCGEGRRPVRSTELAKDRGGTKDQRSRGMPLPPTVLGTLGFERVVTIIGYACACPDTSAPSTPGLVLDPFSGTGTTALVAAMLGRTGIGVDASADYCRLAEWRANDPKERARAAGLDPDAVARIKPEVAGQASMFDLTDGAA